jgi:farnesyl diphosphate synthase
MSELPQYFNDISNDLEALLSQWMAADQGDITPAEKKLRHAMGEAVLAGGKRLRPGLCVATADMFGVERSISLILGGATELIHAYSLVHDDLPAMDDSPLRRGRPSIHKAYDEATAILVGDALQAMAFEKLADENLDLAAGIKIALVRLLAVAAGARGMVGGQMIDMTPDQALENENDIRHLQALKTGAMIEVAIEMGAVAGGANTNETAALKKFGQDLGFAFQIIDDLLDHNGDATSMGKPVGQDNANDKPTFVEVFGEDKAISRVDGLIRSATGHLQNFGEKAAPLMQLAHYVRERTH